MLTGTWLGRLARAGWFSVPRADGGERSCGVVAARPPPLPPVARGIMRELRGIAPWLNPALLSDTGPCDPAKFTEIPPQQPTIYPRTCISSAWNLELGAQQRFKTRCCTAFERN